MKTKTTAVLALLATLLAIACGGSEPAPAAPKEATAPASSRPSCDAIDHACDPYEDKGGLAKECHELGESTATAEAVCAKRKAECLAACPAKS